MKLQVIALALVVATVSDPVAGHANIVEPAAQWQSGYPNNGPGSTMTTTPWGKIDGATYGYGGEGALKYIGANFPKSEYKSLKALILAKQTVQAPATAECGYTIKVDSKRVPLTPVVTSTSFFHPGPCEVWCDDQKLAYALDCQTAYPDGKIAIDTSKCAGADRLTTYWLAVHGDPWQIYIDCVYLSGSKGGASGGGGGGGSAPTSASPPTAPASPPAAQPTPSTRAPVATTQTPTITTKTPALTPSGPVAGEATITPKPTTAAPVKNCKRNRNRQ